MTDQELRETIDKLLHRADEAILAGKIAVARELLDEAKVLMIEAELDPPQAEETA